MLSPYTPILVVLEVFSGAGKEKTAEEEDAITCKAAIWTNEFLVS
jgi:hypothetical protein